MTKFDKKIKKLSKEFQVPETYHDKVDEVLEKIQEDCIAAPRKKPFAKVMIVMAVLCFFIIGYLCLSDAEVAEAGLLEVFRQTMMDFLGMDEDESQKMGIESEKKSAVSKPDLMMELQEVVMDTQNIYAMVKITAPADVEFKEGMTFDYFGFCEGSNYNVSKVVPGARDCSLLEILRNKNNVATYVISIVTDEQIAEGEEVTVFFKDLISGPYESEPQVLVEGMWSLCFTASYTDAEDISVEGTEDMKYSFLGTMAAVQEVKLLPLGMTLVSDVSGVPVDTLHTSDTRITIRLKMLDGTERVVDSPNMEERKLTSGGSVTEYEKDGRIYHEYVCQFAEAIDTGQVLGIYIEDGYVPLKEYE